MIINPACCAEWHSLKLAHINFQKPNSGAYQGAYLTPPPPPPHTPPPPPPPPMHPFTHHFDNWHKWHLEFCQQ